MSVQPIPDPSEPIFGPEAWPIPFSRPGIGLPLGVTDHHINSFGHHSATIRISPAVAESMRVRNIRNRNESAKTQNLWAEDMKAGRWRPEDASIKFGWDGVLLDGQNRLGAIIRSGLTTPMRVVWNMDPATQLVMDQGLPRGLDDVTVLVTGTKISKSHSATISAIYAWEVLGQRRNLSSVAAAKASRITRMEFWQQHAEEIAYCHTRGSRIYFSLPRNGRKGAVRLGPSGYAVIVWALRHIDPEQAEFFFARLSDGQGLMAGDPIYTLRRSLEKFPDANTTIVYICRAWNAYRKGEQIHLLQTRRTDTFPEPI